MPMWVALEILVIFTEFYSQFYDDREEIYSGGFILLRMEFRTNKIYDRPTSGMYIWVHHYDVINIDDDIVTNDDVNRSTTSFISREQ